MPYTAYPTSANVLELLPSTIAAGVPSFESDAAIDSAISEFENQTGWRPFLSNDVAEERILPAPDYRTGRSILKLPQGAIEVTEVEVDLNESGVGTVLTVEREYHLEPTGADDDNRPFTRIVFGRFGPDFQGTYIISDAIYARQSAFAGKCKVTAKWGFCLEIPAEVYLAIARKAAGDILAGARTRLSGGMVSWEEGDVKENYGSGSSSIDTTINEWNTKFQNIVAKYARLD